MNLYLISQDENNDYDTYDAAVVCAENAEQARDMYPYTGESIDWQAQALSQIWDTRASKRENVNVELLGTTVDHETRPRVILASFNAG